MVDSGGGEGLSGAVSAGGSVGAARAPMQLQRPAFEQVSDAQRALLAARGLRGLAKCLFRQLPAAFGGERAELHLHDPDGELSQLVELRKLQHQGLELCVDSNDLYRLYPDAPDASLLALDDPRMFNILAAVRELPAAAMLPLFDGGRLIGSYHLALGEMSDGWGDGERELLGMLGQLISVALRQAVDYEKAQELTFVDPVTEVGNLRAFRRDMQREIAWARRVKQPLSLLYLGLDDLDELLSSFGEVACRFLQRRVSQRLLSDLRATDYMAHVAARHFTVLLPSCSEPHAHDIAERIRQDVYNFPIDDGRGAVLHVTLSIGLLCWEPERHPVESGERLAEQMESEAQSAMRRAERSGGNAVQVARLGLLMV